MNQFLDILLLASFVIGGVYSLWTSHCFLMSLSMGTLKFVVVAIGFTPFACCCTYS